MAYVFQYVRILKLREDEEQVKKSELAKAQYLRDRAQADLVHLQEEKANFDEQRESRLLDGLKASELIWIRQSEQWFLDAIETLRSNLRQAELEVINARVALVRATQEKKKFEKLKEISYARYLEEEAAKEAVLVDSLVTYKSTINKGGDEG